MPQAKKRFKMAARPIPPPTQNGTRPDTPIPPPTHAFTNDTADAPGGPLSAPPGRWGLWSGRCYVVGRCWSRGGGPRVACTGLHPRRAGSVSPLFGFFKSRPATANVARRAKLRQLLRRHAAEAALGFDIHPGTGNLHLAAIDAVIEPAVGVPLVFVRHYNSQADATNYGFGAGWSHSFSWRASLPATDIVRIVTDEGDGRTWLTTPDYQPVAAFKKPAVDPKPSLFAGRLPEKGRLVEALRVGRGKLSWPRADP